MEVAPFLEDAPFGILRTKRSLELIELNPSAGMLLKVNPDEHHGRFLNEFFSEDEFERFSSMFADPEATPTKAGFIHKGKSRHPIQLSVSITNEYLIWYIEDRHQEWKYKNKINDLRSLPREYGHDMNNLLTVILSASQLMQMDLAESNPLHEDLRDIIEAANRAAAQTHQFMNLGRRLVMDPESFSLETFIQENEPLFESLLTPKRLDFQYSNELTTLFGPKISVKSSIINLLLHARHHNALSKYRLVLRPVELDEDFAIMTLGVYFHLAVAFTLAEEGYPLDEETLHSSVYTSPIEAEFLTLSWEGAQRANGVVYSRKAKNGRICISLYFPDMSNEV